MPATLSTPIRSFRLSLLLAGLSLAALVPCVAAAQTQPEVSTLVALSGSRAAGGVVLGPSGDLYGASNVTVGGQAGGLLFRVDPDGSSVETLYQFGEGDGVSPQAPLLLGSDGVFYGTTRFGVTAEGGGPGTLFSVRPDGTGFTTLHTFAPSSANNQDGEPINTDGAFPDAALIEGDDGMLYGVTRSGGDHGTGTVFRIAKNGTGFQTLHEFGEITSEDDEDVTENADGAYPTAGLEESSGYFYGSASRGGANGRGTLFRLRFDGSGFEILHVFTDLTTETGSTVAKNEDGVTPSAALLDGGDGFLYGTAVAGGANGVGTLFAISADGTAFTTLHDFNAPNGASPVAPVILGNDGRLYGVTTGGGTNADGDPTSAGTIFSIARDGTAFTKIYSFVSENGVGPNTELVQLDNSTFIGTTTSGGRCGEGTVYSLSLTGEEIEGDTTCGGGFDDGGGGRTAPLTLLLWLALFVPLAVRHRRSAG
jgi:uncharacterized repeat protein (TIGR03803 family)